jgi:hypothetical protein
LELLLEDANLYVSPALKGGRRLGDCLGSNYSLSRELDACDKTATGKRVVRFYATNAYLDISL